MIKQYWTLSRPRERRARCGAAAQSAPQTGGVRPGLTTATGAPMRRACAATSGRTICRRRRPASATARRGGAAGRRRAEGAARLQGRAVRARPERPAPAARRAERRHLRRRERRRPHSRAAPERGRRRAPSDERGVRRRSATIRSASPSIRRRQSANGSMSPTRLGRPLSLSQWRPEGARAGRDGRRATADRRPWTRDIVFSPDGTRCSSRSARARNVAEGGGKLEPAALRQWEPEHAARRGLGQRDRSRRRARVRSRRQEPARLRDRHPQLRRPGDRAGHRRPLVLDQRARRARRQPAAGLRHARARGRVLRLALVLHRRQRGSAAPRRSGPISPTRSPCRTC